MNRPAQTPHPLLMVPTEGAGAAAATETGRMFERTDWAATPLGPVEHWPQSLRIAASICLNSRFPMFVWWGPSLVNIYNDAYVPILGKRHPQAFGRPALDSWSDIWDVLGPQVEAVMRHGRPTWNERVLLVMERNGFPEDTWFTWSYSPVHDDAGAIGGLFCACTEETGRVAAERERDRLVREAQDAAQTLQTWFDNAPGFIALLRGPDLVFEMVNQAYYQLVGHRQIEGLPVFQALPDLRHQGFEELLHQVYASGEPFTGRAVRLVVQKEPGGPLAERFVDLVYQPVRDASGQVVGIFAQGNDVTEQVKAVNALTEADRRKDEFLAMLAHELRNPLAPIAAAADLLTLGRMDEARVRHTSAIISRQVRHMTGLVDDLLDVSRVTRGLVELEQARVDAKRVVRDAGEQVRPLIEARRHRLSLHMPPEPVFVRGDHKRLVQVVGNLLNNAAKYTPEGGEIEVRLRTHDAQVELVVDDNGTGMTPELAQRAFELFAQAARSSDRSQGGLGIGLALVRSLVELHGGRVTAHSDGPGRGSRFTVCLPRLVEPPPAADAPGPALAAPAAQPLQVMVVDDNADAAQLLAMLVETLGHQVTVETNPLGALERARTLRPQLFLLDIGLPDMDGKELARRLRADPATAGARLVAITGYGQEHDRRGTLAAGFDAHFVKPVDVSQLARLLADTAGD
ncbi:hybrid sensor histidine kinase/response regulator [Ramlibacter tataouinensis]|uniref:histidine kinase n=1 Tax=Ramlibacter tataouinensis (strain ATCC BAA-407 / DSM 14655 / LMG 21543 / TTB310) TaxID=365046 RepID=F5XW89_RAMTT|nr:ATP-binding protein [Ramlibacter tataouinensis]AEG91659.1 candidate histidine kinase, hybrid [Ramlibacter tataouinensis TTB310]